MKRLFFILLVFHLLFSDSDLFGQCAVTINTFPYQESFETGTANWFSGGTNNDWAWGAPTKPTINAAGAGNNCWISGGLTASFYSLGERSWVQSPCFDFTNLDRPYISFLVYWETERKYDGGNFQYSLDGGTTWINAGSYSDPQACNDRNWFNYQSITNLNGLTTRTDGWSGTTQATSGSCNGGGGSGGWVLASHCLKQLGGEPRVKFRFTFGSGTTCNDFDGLAFDDIYIGEAPSITNDVVYNCVDERTLHFHTLVTDCFDTWNWDFGDTVSADNLANVENTDHEFSTGGYFTVTLTTHGACSVDTTIVKQLKILSTTPLASDVSCDGDSDGTAQVIVNNAGPGISYSWPHDSQLHTSFAFALKAGTYEVIVAEPSTCSLSVEIDVGYGPDAFPTVSLGDDTTICPGSERLLFPGSFTAYQWQDNSSDSVFSVSTEGIYSVMVTNKAGCLATDTLLITEDCLHDIIVPNAFTPNGDGVNEFFTVGGSETSEYTLFIFNRWGEMIYKSVDRDSGWDGIFKGRPVQEGIYNYLVNYSIGKEERTKNGSIYLYR